MPKHEQRRASLPAQRSAHLPGLWQAALITALSAALFGYWARPASGTADARAATNVSALSEVAPQEETAALETVAGSREQLARFEQREACSRRLAWVTVMRAPGQPPGRIRLQSGGYYSPAFDLGEAPVRVALPYPTPYASGHGAIAVLGTTTAAVVALTPAWTVAGQAGLQLREVTWVPAGNCPGK